MSLESWFRVEIVRWVFPVPLGPWIWIFLLLFSPSRLSNASLVFSRSMKLEGMCSGRSGSMLEMGAFITSGFSVLVLRGLTVAGFQLKNSSSFNRLEELYR